eukprot:EG_transcript_7065
MEPPSPLEDDAVPLSASFAEQRKVVRDSPVQPLKEGRPLMRWRHAVARTVGPAMPYCMAFGIGTAFAAQSGMSAALTNLILGDSVLATVCNFIVGTIYLLLLNAAAAGHALSRRRFVGPECPTWWWLFPGGLLGALALGTRILGTGKIGFTLTSVTAVTGQLLASVVVDQFGVMGMPRRAITVWRAVGVVSVLAGCILSTLGPSPLRGSTDSIALLILYSALSMIGAAGLPLQNCVNRKLAVVLHGFLRSGVVSFSVSLVALAAFVSIANLIDSDVAPLTDLSRLSALPAAWWWMLLPGVVGATYNASAPFLASRIGMSRFFVLLTAGQFIASLAFDSAGSFFQPARSLTAFRVAGLVLVFAAAIVVTSAPSRKAPAAVLPDSAGGDSVALRLPEHEALAGKAPAETGEEDEELVVP